MPGSGAAGPVIFLGTPQWAVPSLRALSRTETMSPLLVITNADRPAGRGYELKPPPTKVVAQELGLEVFQPDSMRDPAVVERIRSLGPRVGVVVAYGKILPAEILSIPELGFVNLHFSLLPEYRGAAPVQWALIDGKSVTGLSIMVLTEGMDEGPVLSTLELDIDPDETAGELGDRLAVAGADLLVETLTGYCAGMIEPREQDHASATYAPKISNEDARIDWNLSARDIKNKVRGLNPAPGAWTTLRDVRLKLHRVASLDGELAPGVTRFEDERWTVGTGEGIVEILEAQSHGKRRSAGPDLARGMRLGADDRLV